MNKETRIRIYNKYGGRCAYCGQPVEYKDFQVDHLVPLRRGTSDQRLQRVGIQRGTDEIENLMPACRSCNFRKSEFTLEQFRQEIDNGLRVLSKYFTYEFMKRYGKIEEKPGKTVFYFEKTEEL